MQSICRQEVGIMKLYLEEPDIALLQVQLSWFQPARSAHGAGGACQVISAEPECLGVSLSLNELVPLLLLRIWLRDAGGCIWMKI